MADVLANLKDWSTVASSNLPGNTTVVGTGLDDNFRQIQATVRTDLASIGSNVASSATCDIGAAAGLFLTITGSTTITSLGTVAAGVWKILTLPALTLTHNATSLICPGNVNLVATAGDVVLAESLGAGNWKIMPYYVNNPTFGNVTGNLLGNATSATNLSDTASDKMPNISATMAASAMTIAVTSMYLDFRNAALSNGTPSTVLCAPANLVIPATATLGTTNATLGRQYILEMNNAGTAELAIIGSPPPSDQKLISTTAIAAASNSSTIIYSTTARTSLPFRVVGWIESTQATAGTWVAAVSLIQPYIGSTFSALINFNIITASNAAWTPNDATKKIFVQACGGGGGGGGGSGSLSNGGGGGSAGTIGSATISAPLAASYNVVIGAGGAGGIAVGNGGAGGATSFGAALAVAGGLGGSYLGMGGGGGMGSGVTTAAGGSGAGAGGVGDGFSFFGGGGGGGMGFNGAGGVGGAINVNGSAAAVNTGGGGGGAGNGTVTANGGAGGSGVIYVWEFA